MYWAMSKNGWFSTKLAMDLIIKNKNYTSYDSSYGPWMSIQKLKSCSER
ncbi:LOW QUALITY PROTEIN: hypothetical protein V2J09_022972 [Rumex salicifolius]